MQGEARGEAERKAVQLAMHHRLARHRRSRRTAVASLTRSEALPNKDFYCQRLPWGRVW